MFLRTILYSVLVLLVPNNVNADCVVSVVTGGSNIVECEDVERLEIEITSIPPGYMKLLPKSYSFRNDLV